MPWYLGQGPCSLGYLRARTRGTASENACLALRTCEYLRAGRLLQMFSLFHGQFLCHGI